MDLIETVEFWHWWALGGMLGVLEMAAPGFALIWLGLAGILVGLLLLVWPSMDLAVQILAFAFFSVLSVVVWYRFVKNDQQSSEQPGLNRRAEQNIGRRAYVSDAIVNGRGRIRLGDGTWSVTGPDLPAGKMVLITGARGALLEVEPLDDPRPLDDQVR
jgi:membrane protein implicated in regulation of membrane protease activity